MKTKATLLLVLLTTFLQYSSFAQKEDLLPEPDQNKPLLFADMPSELGISASSLDKLLSLGIGEQATILLGNQFNYSGTITSSTVQNNNNLFTVVVKSSNRAGSSLILSKIINSDNTVSYVSRIISFQHGDCYELKTNDNKTYSFIKKSFHEVVSE